MQNHRQRTTLVSRFDTSFNLRHTVTGIVVKRSTTHKVLIRACAISHYVSIEISARV